ncbi:M20/M25/M40 family metallo-hydrolase [Myxococcus qinghaiensis]|uniref:M20/M25/M40 family metallo-hydrolase n=1 Tax=Myxococcus qinghaiensis TaxID=2906758 RepID=UPI0020A7E707|nr:M20/M25/M40 family metallo-hydrolase [Myxococcus qinghaiensis]MCP3162074.1 M20/M25/M40 family metallo-hydrolase [Myxococcus qinghaiensis]
MHRSVLLTSLLLLPALAPAAEPSPEVKRWWGHVQVLADDGLRGRDTGSEGHRKAAAYVARQFASLGIKPGAGDSYLQDVELVSRRLVDARSKLTLVREGQRTPLVIGKEAFISARMGDTRQVDAPMVFVGHGLSIPEVGHDELAGLDLKGKIAVFLYGGPETIPGPLRAHHSSQAERVKALKKAGAIGTVVLMNPKHEETPWARTALSRLQPAMTFADPALDESSGLQVSVTFNPAHAEVLFAGTPHTFKELLALADANQPLPRFELPSRLQSNAERVSAPVKSMNVVGLLPGSDAVLAREYVVLTAHLDHVGVGAPIQGDAIYNGAMDNATGVAAVLEVARALQAQKPQRSILFVLVTGEEKGLLGSRYFAAHPTVPAEAIVANFNLDMFLPLFPLKHLVAYGQDESTLAAPLQEVATAQGVELLKDPEPNRMLFIRSDQYAFILKGVPALSFKFGYAPGSPEERAFKGWYTRHYHAPSDDLRQPIDKDAAVRFVKLLTELTRTVANAPERPRWNDTSFFRRFARATTPEGKQDTPLSNP